MQQEKASRAYCVVTDPSVVRWLTDIERARFLAPFFKDAVTVGEAAGQLCADPNWTYKQVKRLEKQGLLELSHTEAKRGRPLRYYRTVAASFFIPDSEVALEEVLFRIGVRLERTLCRKLADSLEGELSGVGLRVFPNAQGSVGVIAVTSPEADETHEKNLPLMGLWRRMTLDLEDALRLRAELEALLVKYGEKKGAEPYILRLAFAPGTF